MFCIDGSRCLVGGDRRFPLPSRHIQVESTIVMCFSEEDPALVSLIAIETLRSCQLLCRLDNLRVGGMILIQKKAHGDKKKVAHFELRLYCC